MKTRPKPLFGRMSGTITICGDIVGPLDEVWDADAGAENVREADPGDPELPRRFA